MGIFSQLERPDLKAQYPPDHDYWYQPVGSPTDSGVRVTEDSALQISAVYACVKVIAESIASLPLILYRRLGEDQRERAKSNPLYEVLHTRPNQWQTSFEFREMMQAFATLRGNAVARILPGPRGAVDQLIPLRPDRVMVERIENGRLRYRFNRQNGQTEYYTQDEVFHLRGPGNDGIWGYSPVTLHREAIGLAAATERYGNRFFRNFARPGGILSHPQSLKAPARANIKQSWQEAHSGENIHSVAILEEGMTWTQVGMTSEDAQFLQTRQYQVTEIARIFRVPPHMIADLTRATFSNIEHQGIDFVTHTITPWCVRWEQAISRDLIADDTEELFAEFLLSNLMRGDAAARAAYYNTRFQIGTLSRNDIRRLENENPVPGGDVYFVPVNMAPVGDDGLPVQAAAPPAPEPDPDAVEPDIAPRRNATQKAFAVLLDDAADRIACAEIRELEKRASKASEDRKRFDSWAVEFYDVHAAYVRKTVAPIASAWCAQTGKLIRLEAVVAEIVIAGRGAVLSAGDVPTLVDSWKEFRAIEIGESLRVVFTGGQNAA